MRSLMISGIRGGVGVTSLLAGLGYALAAQGKRVLMIDLSPENQLRLHFNLDFAHRQGWARAELDGQPWTEQAFEVLPGLQLLPYGRLDEAEVRRVEQGLCEHHDVWNRRRTRFEHAYDWILFDVPQRLPGHVPVPRHTRGDLLVKVVEADPACHALLSEGRHGQPDLLVVNRFDASSQLQRDLALLWRTRHGEDLSLQRVHRDEALAEALACKRPVGLHAPASQAATDLQSLATWCLVRGGPR